jgi:FKBP-type peptidyl-prolyl cis-trans isomerase
MAAVKGDKPEIEEEKLQAAMQALGDMLQNPRKGNPPPTLKPARNSSRKTPSAKGVVTTKSGLQYEILAKGGDEKYVAPKEGEDGTSSSLSTTRARSSDGKEFDASPEGEPVPMTLQVVEGFKEALTTMPVGAKWKLFMPIELAYGEERRSADIGPNSALIFELELVKIEDAPAAPEGMPFPMPQGQVFHLQGAVLLGNEQTERCRVELVERLAQFFGAGQSHHPAALEIGLPFGETISAVLGMRRDVARGRRPVKPLQTTERWLARQFGVIQMAEQVSTSRNIRLKL